MVGTPMVAVSTLVMAGSLAQVPTVEASPTHGGEQGGTLRDLRRFRFVMAFFHIMCRLVVVRCTPFQIPGLLVFCHCRYLTRNVCSI